MKIKLENYSPLIIILIVLASIHSSFIFGQTTTTFNFTGAPQSYTVPPCVTSITVVVAGADGGGPTGGNGAVVTATITVNPGDVLNLVCGGTGGTITGGYGGGGAGQNANSTANASFGGGGASAIGFGLSPLIIAAGGGGTGGGTTDASGGNGGCASGAAGTSPFGQGGGAASQFAGGIGGPPWIPSGNTGVAGSIGAGGAGATDPCNNNSPGGGGGGGYYGGGGGGSDCFASAPYGGGGGGGGSSLIPRTDKITDPGTSQLLPHLEQLRQVLRKSRRFVLAKLLIHYQPFRIMELLELGLRR
jgi:hypothetical protein